MTLRPHHDYVVFVPSLLPLLLKCRNIIPWCIPGLGLLTPRLILRRTPLMACHFVNIVTRFSNMAGMQDAQTIQCMSCTTFNSTVALALADIPFDLQDHSPAPMEISNDHADLLGRAQVFASEADNDSVMHDRPLCDFMKSHCILCSKHVISLQSLTSHLRANHPGQMQEAIALGIQRARQHTGNLQHGVQTHPSVPCDNTSCSFGDAFQPDTNFRALTGPLPEIVCLIKLPVLCGSVYHSLEVVWKHIIYGHCHPFDPD